MKKVLIIEDNLDVRENTADILELEGYDVSTAENGKIGVKIAKKLLPDIILCDIMMPELDGFGVLEILNKSPETASIPFIFLTARAEKADLRKGMNLGADDYLTKPFNEKDLLDALQSRLKRYDFLKKEFSRSIEGVSQFIEEAGKYMESEHLSKNYSLKKFKKKDWVYMEGNTANSLYFIEKGAIKTFKTTEKGKEFVTGLYGKGQFLGQLSLISDSGSYTESATVLEDSDMYEIPKADFLTLIRGNREVSNKFINLISNNMIEVQEQMVNMAFSSVKQRLAKVLLDLNDTGVLTDENQNGISITREDLAGIIGTATETAIRMLTEFKDQGLVTIKATRQIVIKDKKGLEDLALFG